VILKKAKVMDCKGTRLIVSTPDGTKEVGFDTLINAKRQSREADMVLFKGIAREVYLIGDAKRPRRLHNAIHDGYRLGMVI
jgi:2,4-dienoyl-CoA reductase (NADPH2)